MNETEQLLLITEVSVALVGFAGIIVTFQPRTGARKSRGQILGLAAIVELGLMCGLLAFLPIAIKNFGLSDSTVWSVCSAAQIVLFTSWLIYLRINMRGMWLKGRSQAIINAWWVLNFISLIVAGLNALKVGFDGEPGPYIAVLLNPLSFVGYMFVRLLMRPLWWEVRENEREQFPQAG